jgi:lactam utilization protein B
MTTKELNAGVDGVQSYVLLAARLLLTPLFIYSGIGKILAFGVTASRLPGGEAGLGMLLAAGAIVVDPVEAASRCLRAIAEGKTESINGRDVAVGADSICVHSDTPNAVAVARAVRDALRSSST